MNTTVTTRTLLSGLVAAACATGMASADFTGTHVYDVSDSYGTPPGLRTYRVFVDFTNPADQLLAISGNADVSGLSFSTEAPDGLVNDGGPVSGLKLEDFPAFGAAWDSWVTIGGDTFAYEQADYSPGFAGSDGIHNVIKGTEFSHANYGGWFDPNPSTPEDGGSILIAQFTIAEGYEFTLEGTVDYNPGGNPPAISVYFSTGSNTDPCDNTVEHVLTSAPTDIDGDGAIGFQDLLGVLGGWGPCTPDYVITGQDRWAERGASSYCECWRTRWIAAGFGSFLRNSARSEVRDDGMSLHGQAYSYVPSACEWEYEVGLISLAFDVNVPLPFTFTAGADWYCDPSVIMSLIGPSGFELTDPVSTSGVLDPGHYVLNAAPHDLGDDCDVIFDYELILDGTRCGADIDRDGIVDWRDLLRVLSSWGTDTGTGACCLPDGSCTEALRYGDCLAAGGVVAGWGTWCETVSCP